MNIALDYDGTYTGDPNMWLRFVLDAQAGGHNVWVVTMRYASECQKPEEFDRRLTALQVPLVCTERLAKKPFCEKLGIYIHVWIDDHPEAVHKDAAQIWVNPSPEGQPVVPCYE